MTPLEENSTPLPALAVEVSGNGMRLILSRPLPIGAAVKVEPDDSMILGEVCYCQPRSGGFLVGLKLNQVLSNLEQLAKLNRRLLGEEAREKPAAQEPGAPGTPANEPGTPATAWIGARSRR